MTGFRYIMFKIKLYLRLSFLLGILSPGLNYAAHFSGTMYCRAADVELA